jgi:dihydroneopterin aldolase
MAADALKIRNIRLHGYHGLRPEERTLGQEFEVDIDILGNLAAAGESDDPSLAIDYTRVLELVEQVVTGKRFALVEALAEEIARTVGKAFAPLELTVRVRKPHPPVAASFDGIEVEITRRYD